MMKEWVIFGFIAIFLLSGCEQLKELYGIQPAGEEDYVPIEEIKIEGEAEGASELPPMPPAEEIEEVEEIVGGVEEGVEGEAGETEEIAEEKPKEEAKVIIVKETDLVFLKPKATDPDMDKLVFSYTTPLDNEGRWQTNYGDAGEYTVTITASDGELSVTKDILVIVNKREEAPVIDEAIPKEESLETKESSKLEFSVKASDLNKDPLTYSWKLDGEEKSKENTYIYDAGYDAAGQHTVKVMVSDGAKDTSRIWAVKVENVNRKPILEKMATIMAKENEKVVLEPKATDPDGDKLTFRIDNDKFKQVDGRFEWETTYDNAGEYSATITASDGESEASETVKITIENVNRRPIIEDIIQTTNN